MGTVINKGRISMAATMISSFDMKDHLAEIVSQCLKILPKGTKHVSTTMGDMGDLSRPFEMRFEHPAFGCTGAVQNGDIMDFTWVRSYYENPFEDKLGETIILVGFRYLKPDGTPRNPQLESP